jgi:hypothetical protein
VSDEEVVMDLELLFWAAVIVKVLSIPAVAYLGWIGQKEFQRLPGERVWKCVEAEKRREARSLVPGTAL